MKRALPFAFFVGAAAALTLVAQEGVDPGADPAEPPPPSAATTTTGSVRRQPARGAPSSNLPAAEIPNAAGNSASDALDFPSGRIQRENLINNSPFRARTPRRAQSSTTQVLEIHGFIGYGADLEISLTNPLTRECHWVKVRDPDAKWFIESADPISRTAVVRMDENLISLEMVKPAELLPPAAPPPPTLAGGGAVPVAVPVTAPRVPGVVSAPQVGGRPPLAVPGGITGANQRPDTTPAAPAGGPPSRFGVAPGGGGNITPRPVGGGAGPGRRGGGGGGSGGSGGGSGRNR